MMCSSGPVQYLVSSLFVTNIFINELLRQFLTLVK